MNKDGPLIFGCAAIATIVFVIIVGILLSINAYADNFRARCVAAGAIVVEISRKSVCVSQDLRILEVSRW